MAVPGTVPADKELYQRQIEATNHEIDALVYELYGLTEEEIATMEDRVRWTARTTLAQQSGCAKRPGFSIEGRAAEGPRRRELNA